MNVTQEGAPGASGAPDAPDVSGAPAAPDDVPRWMNVVSVTADVLLSLFKSASGGRKGASDATADDGDG
ncbi:hypothetical protein ACSNOK_12715 [Streptomyces sp. URMC 126]|uniref:hypothetical protein n=1 Tax=Streptomyces sp. URMC 126 TaxID=3423401 RepID=UPI003F1A9679